MPIFSVASLYKSFRIPTHRSGWKGLLSLLSRQYEIKIALDHLSFQIDEGEIVGYIGPNGAGKSTTMKILAGILVPEKGEVKVLGKTPWQHRKEIVRQIGVVFGQRTQLWWDLPVIESFKLLKAIYSIPEESYKKTFSRLVETLGLSALLSIPVRMLSLGQRVRCDLAASLLHEPKILFLDEPTIGLDALSKLALRDFILRINREEKVTILLATHDMEDIELLCQRVIILNKGKIDFDGSLESLRQKILPHRFLVVDLKKGERGDFSFLEGHKETQITKIEGNRLWIRFNPDVISTPQLLAHLNTHFPIIDFFVHPTSIEETVAFVYRENLS